MRILEFAGIFEEQVGAGGGTTILESTGVLKEQKGALGAWGEGGVGMEF